MVLDRDKVTPSEAARILGISAQRVRQLANNKVLAVRRYPPFGNRVFDRSEIERFAAERAAAGNRSEARTR